MHIQRLFTLAMLALAFGAVQAETIDEATAQALAAKFVASTGAPMKAKTATERLTLAQRTAGHYAYNIGQGCGYVIVSADDNVTNTVLGYADSGSFDAEAMPANMKWWLAELDRQVERAASQGVAPVRRAAVDRSSWTAIAPLLTSKWNQDSPYNDQCPTYGGERCYTGCVATAVAQVMYHHKWPATGKGSNSYRWNSKTLSADFSKSTYDWAAMTDTYGSSSTTASKSAVAKLMSDVGIASNMAYSTEGSGAWEGDALKALYNNFSYDAGMTHWYRDYFTTAEWEQCIYNELKASRPLIYCGANASAAHCFVCDGYSSDGYFHINWGWSGMSDGYFLLTVLDPEAQGIGGSSSAYNYNQTLLVGVDKVATGNKPLVCADSLYVTPVSASLSGSVRFGLADTYSYSVSTLNFAYGIKVVSDADGSTTYIKSSQTANLTYGVGYSDINYNVGLSSFPKTAGTYKVYPAFYDNSGAQWQDIKVANSAPARYWKATVSGSTVKFTANEGRTLSASNVGVAETQVYANRPFTVTATITAKGGSYDGTLFFYLYDRNGNVDQNTATFTHVAIDEGGSEKVSVQMTAPSTSGTYYLLVASELDDSYVTYGQSVKVAAEPTGQLTVTGLKNLTVEAGSDFSVTFTGKSSLGLYYGSVNLYVYNGDYSWYGTLGSKVVSIARDASQSITLDCVAPPEAGTYTMGVLDCDDNWAHTYGYTLTVKEATNGIATLPASPLADGKARIYGLDGRFVMATEAVESSLKQLPKGIYVVKQNGKTCKVNVGK